MTEGAGKVEAAVLFVLGSNHLIVSEDPSSRPSWPALCCRPALITRIGWRIQLRSCLGSLLPARDPAPNVELAHAKPAVMPSREDDDGPATETC